MRLALDHAAGEKEQFRYPRQSARPLVRTRPGGSCFAAYSESLPRGRRRVEADRIVSHNESGIEHAKHRVHIEFEDKADTQARDLRRKMLLREPAALEDTDTQKAI